jgi:EamA-like transporter family protein
VYVRKLVPTDTSGIANTAGIMTTGAVALTALRAGAVLLAMSVGGGVLSYLFWNAGIAKLGPARAAIFMNLVPVASMVIAALSGAPPNHAQLLGGALVIGAVTSQRCHLGAPWRVRRGIFAFARRHSLGLAPSTRRKTLPKCDWCSNACDRHSLERACGAAQPVRRIRRQVNSSTEAPRSPR